MDPSDPASQEHAEAVSSASGWLLQRREDQEGWELPGTPRRVRPRKNHVRTKRRGKGKGNKEAAIASADYLSE